MSSRTTKDYEAVFRKKLKVVKTTEVKEVVSDFEKAANKALKVVFPSV